MLSRSVLAVLLFVPFSPLFAADDKSPPEGWKEVKGGYKKQAYSVWLPTTGETTESEDSIVSPKFGQIRIFRTVCQQKDGPQFAAGQIILPPNLTKAPIKVRQEFFRDMFLEEVKGKLVEEKVTVHRRSGQKT